MAFLHYNVFFIPFSLKHVLWFINNGSNLEIFQHNE